MKKYFLILFFISPIIFAGPRQCRAYYKQMKANKNKNFEVKKFDKSPWFVVKDGAKLTENDNLIIETFSEICPVRFYLGNKNGRPTKTCAVNPAGHYCGLIEYGN